MSAITIENDLVHYEVLGRGRPVILLHGWLGSWRYWIPSMQQLSMKYRVYALDFWGFGDSGRDARRYDVASQVMLLDQFMEKLGIAKAALVGHDLGAAVAARYSATHADRVPRLMVVCPPLFWMAPKATPLTANLPPAPKAAPPLTLSTPATAPNPPAPQPEAPAKPGELPVNPDAETVPWRTEEMKARIRAALEKRVTAVDPAVPAKPADGSPKSPKDAATLPTDKPSKEIGSAGSVPVAPLPEVLPEVPSMPKVDYVPEAAAGQVQKMNPLKEHLQIVDRLELLKRHVDPGSDQEKLKAEVEKADTVALAVSVESFADVDTLRDLRTLTAACVMVYGTSDTLLPAPDTRMLSSLTEGRTTFHSITMENTRHFPMLENITDFTRLVMDFLEVPDITKLAIKVTWERRVR